MLRDWLGDIALSDFVADTLQQHPCACPGAAISAVPLLQWGDLVRILAAEPDPDVLVVAKGSLLPIPAPREPIELRALMRSGIGIVLRKAERHDERLARLAASFERDLGGEAHVQLFVTPAATHGFGWHYDFEDVFIVQTVGRKDYYFRDNTVERDITSDVRPDFQQVVNECSPMMTSHLIPGDWLYVPSRWWHMALCVEDSLSISVGIVPEQPEARTEEQRARR